MHVNRWLAAAVLSAVAVVGSSAQADLFGRFLDRSDRDGDAGREGVSFAVADAREIGKIVSPVAYQPLAAPDAALTPIPESYPVGPAPGPAYYPSAGPVPYPVEGHPYAGPVYPVDPALGVDGYPLYHRVEYEDLDHIHPCAVPTVVQVLDPCTEEDDHHCCLFGHHRHHGGCDACQACGPRCVLVKICVPPGCPKIKVSDKGRKVKYDYGDYKVEIESEDGVVSVDYDD
jgi:hypothetical protein